MRSLHKTMLTTVLLTIFAAIPAIAAAEEKPGGSGGKEVCRTDASGKNICFTFECLPSDKTTLAKVPEEDTCLKKKILYGPKTSSNKTAAPKVKADGCVWDGGVPNGSCTDPRKK